MNYNTHIRTARDSIINPSGILQLSFLRLSSGLLQEECEACQEEIIAMKKELATMEEASLRIRDQNGRHQFGCVPNGERKEIAITNDPARIHELARRAYLEKRIDILDSRYKRVSRALHSILDAKDEQRLLAKLQRFDDANLDLTRILFTKEQNEWIDEPYTPNPYNPEYLTEPTKGGILMRSKSEANLGSYLEDLGIPYRYDDIVRITATGWERPNKSTYYADIKCPNFCAGITVHEHLGAFHINNYGDGSLKRLNDYHNFTVYEIPEKPVRYNEFTWSFESDLKDSERKENLIRRILLPYPM